MALGAATTSARRSLKISGAGLDGFVQRIKFYLQDFW
jgi:hypothetical protein